MKLFIEEPPGGGEIIESKSSNIFKNGFSSLIKKLVIQDQFMPKVLLGEYNGGTIQILEDTFTDSDINAICLVDLDSTIDNKNQWINDKIADFEPLNISIDRERIFFMVIEMESWFLSQPEVLINYYKLKQEQIDTFNANWEHQINPDLFISEKLKSLRIKRQAYHKVIDGGQMLGYLDADKLASDFPDVAALRNKLLGKLPQKEN